MSRLAIVSFILAPLLAISVALGLAAWHATPRANPGREAPAEVPDYRPGPVRPINGWLPAGRDDPTPAFDVRNCPDLAQVYDLYPDKDAIPVLERPRFTPAEEAFWLENSAPAVGLKIGSEAKCYPLVIMNWHCLVEDVVGGQSVYVFWDPPSGLALARRVGAKSRPLGLAGLG
jgi:hypothetical protein